MDNYVWMNPTDVGQKKNAVYYLYDTLHQDTLVGEAIQHKA